MGIKKIGNYIALFLLCIFINNANAQQEPQFTQYMDNLLYYNPAYAGSRGMMSIVALHRQQWVGFAGAPMSTTLGFHTPLNYDNVGLGLSLVNDRLGPINMTWANAAVSYAIEFKGGGRLAFGLSGGINNMNGDLISLKKQNNNDEVLNIRYKNEVKFNMGAGIYYHSNQWFIGVAVPRILQNIKDIKNVDVNNLTYNLQRHYYLMLGGYIKVNRMLKLRPNMMFKFTQSAPFALDIGLSFIIYDKFWIGGNYRLKESGAIIFQYQITPQFKFGYAFEMSTTKLGTNSYGTHELMLSYDFLFKDKSLATPRYF